MAMSSALVLEVLYACTSYTHSLQISLHYDVTLTRDPTTGVSVMKSHPSVLGMAYNNLSSEDPVIGSH